MSSRSRTCSLFALTLSFMSAGTMLGSGAAFATSDAARNQLSKKDCVRGKFKDYYRQAEGGDPSAGYTGRVYKLSQTYPDQLPPMENYPWLKIGFKDGGPVDPRAYLQSLLDYGLEGNVEVDFYVEDNKKRKWYGMPWMDWNTEVASDWPGTDGREFVHGLTHEFDSSGQTLSTLQKTFVDTWSNGYFNDRAAFGIGQVYCNPDDPYPGALNPDPAGLNNMANGSYVIKLLFSTVNEHQLPIVKNAIELAARSRKSLHMRTLRRRGLTFQHEKMSKPGSCLSLNFCFRPKAAVAGQFDFG